jgi:hypothetical protein
VLGELANRLHTERLLEGLGVAGTHPLEGVDGQVGEVQAGQGRVGSNSRAAELGRVDGGGQVMGRQPVWRCAIRLTRCGARVERG